MSAPMYMIATNYRTILQMALDEGLDADEELKTALLDIRDELSEKADNISYVIKALLEEEESLKAEAARLAERAKSRAGSAKRLKSYLMTSLQGAGVTKVKCAHFTVSVVKGREVVVIDDEAKIPDDFWETSRSLVKSLVGEALRASAKVPGAHLGTSEPYVLIK